MYLKDVVDQWDYSLAELLNYLDLSYDQYRQLNTINAPLDRRTINFIKAIKLIYSSDKRTRYMRLCNDKARYIMPFEKSIVRGCSVCNKQINDVRALYCSNACRQKSHRMRKSMIMPATQKMLPFAVTL
jgi:hypothetical protein